VTFVGWRGPPVHLLDADTDDLVDADDVAKFRDNLKRLGVPSTSRPTRCPPPRTGTRRHEVVRVTRGQIADLVRRRPAD